MIFLCSIISTQSGVFHHTKRVNILYVDVFLLFKKDLNNTWYFGFLRHLTSYLLSKVFVWRSLYVQGLVLFWNKLYPQSVVITVYQLISAGVPAPVPGVGVLMTLLCPSASGLWTHNTPNIPRAALHNITVAALHLTMVLISHHQILLPSSGVL